MNPFCEGTKINLRLDILAKGYSRSELSQAFYGLMAEPRQGKLLLECASFDEIDQEYNPGDDRLETEELILEAVTVRAFSRTAQTMAALQRVLNKVMADKGLTVGDAVIGKPKKTGLFASVTVQFPISDGQALSIIFHSPDNNKMKIMPDDVIIAFRWLLNKRDITVAVSPEGEKDVSLDEVGKRVSQLVEKNSQRFQAQQKALIEGKKALEDLKATVGGKQDENSALMNALADKQGADKVLTGKIEGAKTLLSQTVNYNDQLQAQIDAMKAQEASNAGKPKGEEGTETKEQIQAKEDEAQLAKIVSSFSDELVGRGFALGGDDNVYSLSLGTETLKAQIKQYDNIGYSVIAGTELDGKDFGNSKSLDTLEKTIIPKAFAWIDKKLAGMKKGSNEEETYTKAYQLFEDTLAAMGFESRGQFKYHIGLIGSRNGKPALEEVSSDFFVNEESGKVVVNADKSTFTAQSKATASNAFDKAITVLQERLKDRTTVDQWTAQYQATVNTFKVGDEYKVSRRTVSPSFEIDSYMEGFKVINVNSIEHGGSQLPAIQLDSDNSSMNIRYDQLQEYLDAKILVPVIDGIGGVELDPKANPDPEIVDPEMGGAPSAVQALNDILAGKYTASQEISDKLDEAAGELEAAGQMEAQDGLLNSAADYLTEILKKEAGGA